MGIRHIAAAVASFALHTGCASAPAAPVELVPDCGELFAEAPEGTTVPVADMPRLLNEGDVQRRLAWLYGKDTSRRAVVQILVQPDGRVSHGCVRQPSGDREFDRAALEAAREARFRPATLAGREVDAWVALPLIAGR